VAPAPMAITNHSKRVMVSGCGYRSHVLQSGRHDYRIEINVQTPHMPITSDGKTPDLGRFEDLLDAAIGQPVARAKRAAGRERRLEEPRSTFKDAITAHLEEATALASGEGTYRFNLRNLFYAIRPLVMLDVGELRYETFTKCITDHENEYG